MISTSRERIVRHVSRHPYLLVKVDAIWSDG